MNLISAHDVRKRHGTRTLLDGVSITIAEGDRLGLIGINGAGKSTLIRVLLGLEDIDAGEIQRKRGFTYTMVAQSPELDPEATVFTMVKRGQEKYETIKRTIEQLATQMANTTDDRAIAKLIEEQSALSDALEIAGGWNIEHRVDAAMHALGVPPRDRAIATLSLGEKRRVALCAAMLEQPELLVLDEPTNHIDVQAIEWLEQELAIYPGALILVTHDRWFLDRVANRHAELDRGDLRLYDGNYSDYLAARAEREAIAIKQEHTRLRAIENELQWVRRRAPARSTKQQARLDRFDQLVAARPKAATHVASFRLPHPTRIGNTILEVRRISKSLAKKNLIRDFDFILKRGDKLGIVGPNGAGKTTLLRMIHGETTPDSGDIVLGQNTCIAYADQRRILNDKNTVLAEVAGKSDVIEVGDETLSVYSFLEGLLFNAASQRTLVSSLSGGERSRVALAKALRVSSNVLILDEPTNDLDLPTLRVLEDAIIDYPGCALIVSHDRYFLDRVTTGILAFTGDGKIVRFDGNYEAFRAAQNKSAAIEPAKIPTNQDIVAAKPVAKNKKRTLTFKEKNEFLAMEVQILQAEAQVSQLESEVGDPQQIRLLGAAIKDKLSALEAARNAVDILYGRWAELSDIEKG